jgi:hypothetical protein
MKSWISLPVCALVSACGLIHELENFKGINFDLPERKYSVSTDDPSWKSPPLDGVPAVSCGAGGLVMDCCTPPPPLPAIDCARSPLACDAGNCALEFTYDQVQGVNLAKEVPSLASSKGQIFSQVLLKTIDVTIDTNSMNVSLPPVNVYLAPASVTSSTSPMAKKVATLSMKTPGYTGAETVPLDEAAQQLFSMYARDYQTPFNIIISTQVVLKAGSPIPKGKLDFRVGGRVEAKF